jgi:hypothetical protein
LPPRALKKPRPGTSPAPVRARKAESASAKRKTEPPKAATKTARKTTVIKAVPLAPSMPENLSADAPAPVATPPSSKKPEGGG